MLQAAIILSPIMLVAVDSRPAPMDTGGLGSPYGVGNEAVSREERGKRPPEPFLTVRLSWRAC